MPGRRRAIAAMVAACTSAHADTPRAEFFRGINLNGPPVVIDGHKWEGGDSKHLETRDQAFENQAVPLIPPTDPERARMIRSSRWNGQADMRVTDIPPGNVLGLPLCLGGQRPGDLQHRPGRPGGRA